SPLSDTTNMASSILDVDLFDHIKNMAWTTLPAFLISFILFALLSPNMSKTDFTKMNEFQNSLLDTGLINWYAALISFAVLSTLFGGYVSETGNAEIDELLTRGGMESMLFTIGIVLLALSLGGLLFSLGIVPKLLQSIEDMLKTVKSVILSSALTAVGINVL